ncbi:MAG: hypothetical protein QOE60_2634 [Thermoleophilaceae bacterium]|nr:hypothetical protein [Thermoleophilaceae bacterium]
MRASALVVCLAALLAVPTAATAAVTAGGTGWVWANPLPQGGDLDAIAFAGARGIAAGANGLILRTEDAGASWSAAASGTDAGLTEVAMPDASTIYVGGGCVLRRSTDGGATFQRVRFATRESKCSSELAQLAFPTPSLGYLVLTDGRVLRTTNGGRSFARRASLNVGSSVPQGGAADAVFTGESTGLISTGLNDPTFLRTVDGGQTWTPIRPVDAGGFALLSRVRSVKFVTALVGYAVSNGGPTTMARTEDGGVTWAPLPLTGASGVPQTIDCADANACVILSGGSTDGVGDRVTWTSDGGLTGTTITLPVSQASLAFSSPTRVVGAGGGGAMLASDDAGHSFARIGGVLGGQFVGLRRSDDRTVFAFARDGTLARTTDGGITWQAIGAAPLSGLVDVSFVTDTVGYILSGGGALERTDDGGASWGVLGGQATGAQALLATGPQTLLAAAADGVLRSTDGGTTFTRAAGASRPVRAFDRAQRALIAYGQKTLLASTNGGASWRALARPRGDTILSVDFVSRAVGFVVRDDGEVVTTADGGRSWRLLTSVGRDDVTKVSFGDARHGFLLLGKDSGVGGVLRTSDGGRSWRPQVIGKRPLSDVLGLGVSGGTALGDQTGHLFATLTGGDAVTRSSVSLRVISRRRRGRRIVVTVGGRLKPAPAGAGVAVTARIGGTWLRKFATVTANGRFRTTWQLRRDTVFVAQWRGAAALQSDGTVPLRVRVGRHRHR